MEKKLKRSFYIIPTIYILLTAFFFFMHYSQRISFSQAIGNIELTGHATKGTMVKPSEIKRLNMFVNGMSFLFNSSEVIKVKTQDGIMHRSSLVDYSTEEDRFVLHFQNKINLVFSTDFADNKITVSAELPDTVPAITEVTLPFKEDRGFSLGYTEEDNTPVISNGETKFFIALANKYRLDDSSDHIIIDVPDNNPITLVIQETLVSSGRTAEKWYEQNDSDLKVEYDEVVSTFINNAFFGWNSRFNSKTGMWTDADGQQQFNETTATSYLSESLVRGSYRTSASLIRTASVPLENDLSAWTAPYLGNIVVKGKEFISDQNIERRELIEMIDSRDTEILKVDNLIALMESNRLSNRVEEMLLFITEIMEEEDVSNRIDRLRLINEIYNDFPEQDFDQFIIDIVENYILPSVNWLDEGLFLDMDGTLPIGISFKAGTELLRSGNFLNNDFYKAVGMKMITSILTRAGESAFIPARAYVEENRIATESGTILPEEFYKDLTENPYYVRQEPLNDSLGEGSWILTSAQNYSIQRSPRETVLSLNFPKGSIHHVAIKGVKPFVRIYMHGMKWNSDPNFQRYSDGWVYDKSTETLYVKLKHRVDNETIRILYYNPDKPTAITTTTESPVTTETQTTSQTGGSGE